MKPYYEHAGITIYHGDCREILPQLTWVDVVLTDLPYSPHTHAKQWIGHALTAEGAARCATNFTELGFPPLSDELREFLGASLARLCRRWVLIFSDLEGISHWQATFATSG